MNEQERKEKQEKLESLKELAKQTSRIISIATTMRENVNKQIDELSGELFADQVQRMQS